MSVFLTDFSGVSGAESLSLLYHVGVKNGPGGSGKNAHICSPTPRNHRLPSRFPPGNENGVTVRVRHSNYRIDVLFDREGGIPPDPLTAPGHLGVRLLPHPPTPWGPHGRVRPAPSCVCIWRSDFLRFRADGARRFEEKPLPPGKISAPWADTRGAAGPKLEALGVL